MELPANRLDPRIKRVWWASGAITTLVLLVAGVVATIILELGPLPLLPAAISALLASLFPVLRYRRWRWEMREKDLLFSRGSIGIQVTSVPLDRIQYSTTSHGPLHRLYGLSVLTVHTAAGKAGAIEGLTQVQADSLRDEIAHTPGHENV